MLLSQDRLLPVTSQSMCPEYWSTALSKLAQEISEITLLDRLDMLTRTFNHKQNNTTVKQNVVVTVSHRHTSNEHQINAESRESIAII